MNPTITFSFIIVDLSLSSLSLITASPYLLSVYINKAVVFIVVTFFPSHLFRQSFFSASPQLSVVIIVIIIISGDGGYLISLTTGLEWLWLNSCHLFQVREHQQQIKEFEQEQNEKFEHVEFGKLNAPLTNRKSMVILITKMLLCEEKRNSEFPQRKRSLHTFMKNQSLHRVQPRSLGSFSTVRGVPSLNQG